MAKNRNLPETKVSPKSTNRVQQVKDFLEQFYEAKINIFDPNRSFIVCKNKDRYKGAINVGDISLHMEEEGIRGCDGVLKKILSSPNQITVFNPIVDFVKSLDGIWKGESEIEKFCSYIQVREFPGYENDFFKNRFKKYLRKWGAAAIAQVLGEHPNDVTLFFVNAQEGMGKTSLAKFLVPPALDSYYQKSNKDPRYFDFVKALTTNFIVNFDDNVWLTRNNAEAYKAGMSEMYFKSNKFFEDIIARMASTLGTSNKSPEMGGFLIPELGTRRFAIVETEHIDYEYSKKVDQLQLWAEFYVLYKTADFNYKWDEEFPHFEEFNRRYMCETNARRLVQEYYRTPTAEDKVETVVFKQAIEILQDLRNGRKLTSSHTNVSEVTIGFALKTLGYERTAERTANGPRYGYKVVQLF